MADPLFENDFRPTCFICGLVSRRMSVRRSYEEEYMEMFICMLQPYDNEDSYYLCERCDLWLSNTAFLIRLARSPRRFIYRHCSPCCFICGVESQTHFFTMCLRRIDNIVLYRFLVQYGSCSPSINIICDRCEIIFVDLVRLHTISENYRVNFVHSCIKLSHYSRNIVGGGKYIKLSL
ncbi:hypothetical protein PPYR_05297 [Photinus pyralis]|uniref:ZAD domain-containing protein n=1 Tax=Photinus pyralis TaxID=7054 RepID=A0A5N4AUK6_PHOPY|nr:hypothetical protein PPYR_05297 [Photinus pyralis]